MRREEKKERDAAWMKFRTPLKEMRSGDDDWGGKYEFIERDGKHFVKYPWGQELAADLAIVHWHAMAESFRRVLASVAEGDLQVYEAQEDQSPGEEIQRFAKWLLERAFEEARKETHESGKGSDEVAPG